MLVKRTANMLAVALLLVPAIGQAQARPKAEAVSPAKWLQLGTGFGVIQGGSGYAATLAFLPSIGGGFRFNELHGVEVNLAMARSINGSNDDKLIETRPAPPALDGVTATYMTIRGSRSLPFNNVLGFGSGAYKEKETG